MEVATTYRKIIRQVMHNVAAELTAEHVNPSVLKELEKSWESKLLQSGALAVNRNDMSQEQSNVGNKETESETVPRSVGKSSQEKTPHTEQCTQQLNEATGGKRKRDANSLIRGDEGEIVSSDSEEGDQGGGDEPVTSDLILSQFEKVSRSKNKWKCNFKDGIVMINGLEYVFSKGGAEFLW